MEHVGAMSEGVWNSLNEVSFEESEFMEQLLSSLSNEVPKCSKLVVSSTFWPCTQDQSYVNNYYSSDDTNSNSTVYSLLSSCSGSVLFPSPSQENFHHTNQISSKTDDYCYTMEDKNNSSRIHVLTTADAMEADQFLTQGVISNDSSSETNRNLSQLGLIDTVTTKSMQESLKEHKTGDPCEPSKKRSRHLSGEVHKNTRNIKTKRGSKTDDNINSSSMCSEEISNDSNAEAYRGASSSSSKACEGSTAKLNGKMRANRGSATDPQSLYARKRRERINERLRILQNLVPNGTKVDISTMLEEAVQYVKFLQLQIKLLSSDNLWMYAPIAYNGMDIEGLDRLKISSTPKSQSSS